MKVAIVDDEAHCVESLALDLLSLGRKIEIVYKTTKPEAALDGILEKEIDLLFLDVEMPGLNGFELLEQLQPLPFDVIFTTAYSRYAMQAFRYQAFNYLLKPVDVSELEEILESWEKKFGKEKQKKENPEIDSLLKYLKKEGMLRSKIAVPVLDGYEFIAVNEIIFCKSENNYTYFYFKNKQKLLISKTLKEAEKTLQSFGFLRIHQSYLVNSKYLKKYQRKDGGFVLMQSGHKLPVSQQKKDLITSFFDAISKRNDT
ncbi:LytR/AlgR family response regulator transcription factor [Pleomorphovibrio marinus]|uniref:LytR/AlgR family response regulator transcription factor n=1 Tax=Pleomorphovibrio marinus TaxID=2164132 RepID=UPI000E0C179F|nr:LytTR family DNA-binding domain-containing protein [Pleomorphovibrio marinus]